MGDTFSSGVCRYQVPQNELPDHLHDWHEIIYVYRGKGTIFIDTGLEDMQEGDLFIIPGSTVHRALPDAGNPVTSSALFFSPGLLASTAGGSASAMLSHLNAVVSAGCTKGIWMPRNKPRLLRSLTTFMQNFSWTIT
ncbi:cupin domain-containing protein [Paenibacillus sp. 1A_MP2]|uniref:cupin domain-containing protein n=1 Tax=Paenibacillus sp. 1A_MP2 TaxID=3457495 RepID=UPI003FCCD229